MHPRFSCASYEATTIGGQIPMATHIRRRHDQLKVLQLVMAQDYATLLWNLNSLALEGPQSLIKTQPLFSNLSCPIPFPLNPFFHMVRKLADWVAPYPSFQHPFPPLKFLHAPSSPPHLLVPTCMRIGACKICNCCLNYYLQYYYYLEKNIYVL